MNVKAMVVVGLVMVGSVVGAVGCNSPTLTDLASQAKDAVASGEGVKSEFIQVRVEPPAPIVEVRQPPPSNTFWVPGHWQYNGVRYIWIGGHYETQQAGWVYVNGHYDQVGGAWRWIPGHWRRALSGANPTRSWLVSSISSPLFVWSRARPRAPLRGGARARRPRG